MTPYLKHQWENLIDDWDQCRHCGLVRRINPEYRSAIYAWNPRALYIKYIYMTDKHRSNAAKDFPCTRSNHEQATDD